MLDCDVYEGRGCRYEIRHHTDWSLEWSVDLGEDEGGRRRRRRADGREELLKYLSLHP